MKLNSISQLLTSPTTRVLRAACDELQRFLIDSGHPAPPDPLPLDSGRVPSRGSIVVGVNSALHCFASLVRRGVVELQDTPAGVDAFEWRVDQGVLYLLGTTDRGLLHAVYALRDHVRAKRRADEPDESSALAEGDGGVGRFHFPRRVFHQRFQGWPGTRSDVRYLSQLGATECLTCHDWHGELRHLHAYAPSDVFPDALPRETVEQQAAALRTLVEDCLDFAIAPSLWITELPCQGGPWVPETERQAFLTRYPAEVLSDSGTYQGRVLCFGHERVKEFYRRALKSFFARFPEVETLYVFNVDSSGEFCDPASCPRCAGVSKMAQRNRFVAALQEWGEACRPGLCVLTTNWGWDLTAPDELLPRQAELPANSGIFFSAQYDGWQAERQIHGVMTQMRQTCRERGQVFLGFDNLHWGDDSVHLAIHLPRGQRDIQDFPFGVAKKLRRWAQVGADGVVDHWGTWGEDAPINSLACREFFLNPFADPDPIIRRLAIEAFGADAGPLAFAGWRAIESAHRILSAACTWSPWQWPAWYGFSETPATHEALLGKEEGANVPIAIAKLMKTALKPRHASGFTYNQGDFVELAGAVGESWRAAAPHLLDAVKLLERASKVADDRPVAHQCWWSGVEPVPTRREHLRRQAIYAKSNAFLGKEVGLHFTLMSHWATCWRMGEEVRTFDHAGYRSISGPLLRENAAACRDVATFLTVATSPAGSAALSAMAARYRKKAEAIDAHLA